MYIGLEFVVVFKLWNPRPLGHPDPKVMYLGYESENVIMEFLNTHQNKYSTFYIFVYSTIALSLEISNKSDF